MHIFFSFYPCQSIDSLSRVHGQSFLNFIYNFHLLDEAVVPGFSLFAEVAEIHTEFGLHVLIDCIVLLSQICVYSTYSVHLLTLDKVVVLSFSLVVEVGEFGRGS